MAGKREHIVQSSSRIQSDSGFIAQLTDLDRRLIAELQSDGRMPFNALAETLGISEATVQRRTAQLIEQGYFKIVATVDPLLTGEGHAVMVALRCDPGALHAVTEAVAALPQMRFVALVTGTYDIVCELVTFSRQSTVEILTDTLSTIPGIRAINTSWVLENHKTKFRWDGLVSSTNGSTSASVTSIGVNGNTPLVFDELDEHIVAFLKQNGRASYAHLATQTGATISTVRRRTLRLLQSGYLNVVALGNPFRLGFEEVVLLWLKTEMNRTAEVLRALEQEPAVRYLSRVAGEADILAEAFFPHRAALLGFMDGSLARIEGLREAALSFELMICKRAYTLFE